MKKTLLMLGLILNFFAVSFTLFGQVIIEYIHILDTGESSKLAVFKLSNGTWLEFPEADFTYAKNINMVLQIGRGSTPYLSYLLNDGAYVWRYNGEKWEALPHLAFNAHLQCYDFILDSEGIPVVAFQGGEYDETVSVMRLESRSWLPVGKGNFSPFPSTADIKLATDSGNILYVCGKFTDYNDWMYHAFKFTGTSWKEYTLTPLIEEADSGLSGIMINSHGSFYLSYKYFSDPGSCKIHVANNNEWDSVYSRDHAGYVFHKPRIALGLKDEIFLLHTYGGRDEKKVTVAQIIDNNAVPLGDTADFIEKKATMSDLTVSEEGTIYLAFTEWLGASGTRITVLRWINETWEAAGRMQVNSRVSDIDVETGEKDTYVALKMFW
jgi:hypothetical protein